MQETAHTLLVAVLTGLVYAGFQTGLLKRPFEGPPPCDAEKGLWRGIPVEELRTVQVVVQSAEEESKEDIE